MTLYDEGQEVFGRRPTKLALSVTSFCILILSAQFTTLALSLADAVLAYVRGARLEVSLYAPLADAPALLSGTFGAAAAGIALLAAVLLGYFSPADRSFFSFLVAQSVALTLLTFVTIPTGFVPATFAALARATGVKAIIWCAAVLLIGVCAVIAIEGRAVAVTAHLFALETPLRRAGWWALRLLPGLLALASLSFLNDYQIGVLSVLLVLLMTLLENLWRAPRPRSAALKHPYLRESAAALPIITAAIVAGSVYLFGMEAAGRPQKVIAYSPKHHSVGSKLATTPPEKPVIDIRWSNPNRTKPATATSEETKSRAAPE